MKNQETNPDTNVVMIGIKPFMNYVTALKMQFDKNNEVFVYARGKFISKAFDVIEVCKRTFLIDSDIGYSNIKVESNKFTTQDSRQIYVSSIEIKLVKSLKDEQKR
jgi:DNA-binding protein Alba